MNELWKRRTGTEDLYDGDQLIVALRVCKRDDGRYTTYDGKPKYRWSIESVVVRCDEDYFSLEDSSGEPWGWSWEDVEFWMKSDVLSSLIPGVHNPPVAVSDLET